MNTPLAERMRPKTLADYYGQEHLVGPQGSLTQMIKNGVFLPPSQFEAWFLSSAISEEDLYKIDRAVDKSFQKIQKSQ